MPPVLLQHYYPWGHTAAHQGWVALNFPGQSHDVTARWALVTTSTGVRVAGSATFAATLAAAVKARGLGLERLRHHLARADCSVSVATLSSWQSGTALPTSPRSMATVAELELVLLLPPGDLVRRVERELADRRSPGQAAVIGTPLLPAGLLDEARAAWGHLPQTSVAALSVHDILRVGPGAQQTELSSRVMLRALISGTARCLLGFDVGACEGGVVVGASHCTVTRQIRDHNLGTLVAEIVFPHPLEVGELILVEYTLTHGPGPDANILERAVVGSLHELVLGVEFVDPAPAEVTLGYRPGLAVDAPPTWTRSVKTVGGAAQYVVLEPPEGVYGLYWPALDLSWPRAR